MGKAVQFDLAALSPDTLFVLGGFLGPPERSPVPEIVRWFEAIATTEIRQRSRGPSEKVELNLPDLLPRQRDDLPPFLVQLV